MKLDEKYFEAKQTEILFCKSDATELTILKQIAADAREYQAGKDRTAVDDLELRANRYIPWRSDITECLAQVKAALDRAKGE